MQCLNVCFVLCLVYYVSVQRNLVLAHFDASIFHRQCGIPREGGHASPDAGGRKTSNVMNVSKSQETGWKVSRRKVKSFNRKTSDVKYQGWQKRQKMCNDFWWTTMFELNGGDKNCWFPLFHWLWHNLRSQSMIGFMYSVRIYLNICVRNFCIDILMTNIAYAYFYLHMPWQLHTVYQKPRHVTEYDNYTCDRIWRWNIWQNVAIIHVTE